MSNKYFTLCIRVYFLDYQQSLNLTKKHLSNIHLFLFSLSALREIPSLFIPCAQVDFPSFRFLVETLWVKGQNRFIVIKPMQNFGNLINILQNIKILSVDRLGTKSTWTKISAHYTTIIMADCPADCICPAECFECCLCDCDCDCDPFCCCQIFDAECWTNCDLNCLNSCNFHSHIASCSACYSRGCGDKLGNCLTAWAFDWCNFFCNNCLPSNWSMYWGSMLGNNNTAYTASKDQRCSRRSRKKVYLGPPPQSAMINPNTEPLVVRPTAPEYDDSLGGDHYSCWADGERKEPGEKNGGSYEGEGWVRRKGGDCEVGMDGEGVEKRRREESGLDIINKSGDYEECHSEEFKVDRGDSEREGAGGGYEGLILNAEGMNNQGGSDDCQNINNPERGSRQ